MNSLLKYFLLVFWSVWITKRVLFYLYWWQFKGYMIKRAGEEVKRRPSVFFQKSFFLALFLLAGMLMGGGVYWKAGVVFFYFLLFSYAVFQLVKRKWVYPEMTKKMILLTGVTFLALFLPVLFFLSVIFRYVLFLEIFLLLFVLFWGGLVEIPVHFAKNHLKHRAKEKRKIMKDLKVVGITGSFGKSSTKEFLYELVEDNFFALKTDENLNTDIGIAKKILKDLKKQHELFVVEMGAHQKGQIKASCRIARPDVAVLTGIGKQHLALFGSLKKTVEAKFELVDSLKPHSTVFLNGENALLKEKIKDEAYKDLSKIFCTIEKGGNFSARNIQTLKGRLSFNFYQDDKNLGRMEAPLVGRQNITNLILALACAFWLGVSFEDLQKKVRNLQPLEKTMKVKKGRGGVDVLDDTYSASPKGVEAALSHLRHWEGKKVVVMPCLIELGKESEVLHEKLGEKIGEVCDLMIVTNDDYFKFLRRGALASGMKEENILQVRNVEEIKKKIKPFLKEGNIVLLESRVPDQVIDFLNT